MILSSHGAEQSITNLPPTLPDLLLYAHVRNGEFTTKRQNTLDKACNRGGGAFINHEGRGRRTEEGMMRERVGVEENGEVNEGYCRGRCEVGRASNEGMREQYRCGCGTGRRRGRCNRKFSGFRASPRTTRGIPLPADPDLRESTRGSRSTCSRSKCSLRLTESNQPSHPHRQLRLHPPSPR